MGAFNRKNYYNKFPYLDNKWKRCSFAAIATILMLSVPATMGIGWSSASAATPVCAALPISTVTASGQGLGTVPANAIDGNLNTKWSSQGRGSWISLDLGRLVNICYVDVAWYRGNTRQNTFTISDSSDGSTFAQIFAGQSQKNLNFQRYDFADSIARQLKITVIRNTENNWASITEIKVYGYSLGIQDTVKPLVTIDRPISGSEVFTASSSSNTANIIIAGKAFDSGSGIKLVEVKAENTGFKSASPASAGNWAQWTSSLTLPVGNHQLVARATDNSGNQQTSVLSLKISQKSDPIQPQTSNSGSTGTISTGSSSVGNGGTSTDLFDPHKKDIALQLVSSAENSSLDWRAQYKYIEDIGDGRGYTAGIMGFCSGTGDMLDVVQFYTQLEPNNILAKYIPALERLDGSSSHSGLDPTFVADWKTAANDPLFQQAQDHERDMVYFNPAVQQAKADGLHALGQFIYFDAMVMHGPGDDPVSFGGIRATAMQHAKTPAQGGDETTYLNAFLDARVAAMHTEAAHDDTSRVDTEQRVFLQQGNLGLNTPLSWHTYGDPYTISQ